MFAGYSPMQKECFGVLHHVMTFIDSMHHMM